MADLVGPRGSSPVIASWDHALDDPNLEDAAIDHKLKRLAQVPGLAGLEASYRKRFRHKSWQYMTAVSDDVFIAFVIGTAGFASNGFVYAVELPSGKVHSKFAITPFAMGARLSTSSAFGSHRFAVRGLTIAIENLAGGRRFAARITGRTEGRGELAAELHFASGERDDHVALCVPLAGNRWNYTHKFGAFDVTGHVDLDGKRSTFRSGHAWGTVDFTKMYALRHAVWRWVALCGRSTQGPVIGLNLVDPTPVASISENAAWIDGRSVALTDVQLEAERPEDVRTPWRLHANGLDMTMRAVAHVEQKLDVPLVRHRLRHVVGAFSGTVSAGGKTYDLDSIVGIAEDNDTWW